MVNFAVGKVIDSNHPEFTAGDLVWGMTGWEEYTLVTEPESLKKVNHTELPLLLLHGGSWSAISMTACTVCLVLQRFAFKTCQFARH
jgi:NADPH-dependent curcumin reductase CurA